MESTLVPAVALDELKDNFASIVEVEDRTLVVARQGEKITAFDGICTHAEFALGPGLLRDGCIECPMHMARFDANDGSVQKGPAREPARQYEVQIVDGVVHVSADWL